ncbi:MAG: dihydrofolate reductase [Planctomycetales bacterium]|nr:dihydrofolate reductase [Planctomycetales bacterium]
MNALARLDPRRTGSPSYDPTEFTFIFWHGRVLMVSLIVAMAENRVIGRDGDLPWRLSSDLRRFKQLTMGHHLLMGRVTWDSLGRALPGRTSIVISRRPLDLPDGVLQATSLESALELAAGDDEPFVIGGAQIYRLALPVVSRIYLTEVLSSVDGDVLFPELHWSEWRELRSETLPATDRDEFPHRFRVLERIE